MHLRTAILRKSLSLIKTALAIPKEKNHNIISIEPTYKIVDKLTNHSIVVDLGTGEDADFSQNLINKYGLKAFGFDPTTRHHSSLDSVVKKFNGRFVYYKYAISRRVGKKTFFESSENRSGSFFDDHSNIKKDVILSYVVETIGLASIFDILKTRKIDVMKMDTEGEEYSVLSSSPTSILKAIDQIIVEFHHDTVNRFSFKHTQNIIRILEAAGFAWHTVDYVNYLFFRHSTAAYQVK